MEKSVTRLIKINFFTIYMYRKMILNTLGMTLKMGFLGNGFVKNAHNLLKIKKKTGGK